VHHFPAAPVRRDARAHKVAPGKDGLVPQRSSTTTRQATLFEFELAFGVRDSAGVVAMGRGFSDSGHGNVRW